MRGETVTILRAGAPTIDRYGNEVPGADVRIDVDGCFVAPRLGGDVTEQGRQGIVVGSTVYFPARTDVRSTDRLEVRGAPHTIQGQPGDWTNGFTGRRFGVEVATERVEG